MRIHCFQHVSFENPANIVEWAALRQHFMSYTYFFEKTFSFPNLDSLDVLLVLGGYMNVDEEQEFPWLKKEKAFIREAITAGKKVIGICLGSQLIASALGEKVYPNKVKEIGFYPIQFSENALVHPFFKHLAHPYTVFHWHGDTFDLPKNAQIIASTDACLNQAFLIGNNVLALQFHFEMNEEVLDSMLFYDGHELEEKGVFIASPSEIRNGYDYLKQNKKDLFLLLDAFLAV
jgi:GMP synthase-like glutamine amidotransferase